MIPGITSMQNFTNKTIPVLIIETDGLDIVKSKEAQKKLLKIIKIQLK